MFCFDFAQDGGEKIKGDPMDLRLDIERRKKYSTHERYYNEDQGRDAGDSPDSSRERSVENFHKYHKKSKYAQLFCTCIYHYDDIIILHYKQLHVKNLLA